MMLQHERQPVAIRCGIASFATSFGSLLFTFRRRNGRNDFI
jgi:hypothetical protein